MSRLKFLMMNQSVILFSFCVFFTLCLHTIPANAQEIQCPRHKIETSLKGKLTKTRVFRGPISAFTEYVQGHDRGESRVLGFVNQAELYTQLDYSFDVAQVNGGYCVLLKQVRGFLYAAPKLFLPSEYRKKSCEYQQILKHEKRHLNAVYKFHERNTGKYAAYLGKIAREIPVPSPVYTKRDIDMVKGDIANYFEDEFRELEYQSLLQLNREQAKIDSQQEYLGVSKRCNNW